MRSRRSGGTYSERAYPLRARRPLSATHPLNLRATHPSTSGIMNARHDAALSATYLERLERDPPVNLQDHECPAGMSEARGSEHSWECAKLVHE